VAREQDITFDNPPVSEVVLGRTFLPRPDFLLPYYGAFWERVKKRFPRTEHAAPIFDGNMGSDPYFLPRVWFVAEDATTLLQLQNDRLHFNWRQMDGAQKYVRFPRIQRECLDVWAAFEEFVLEMTDQALQPQQAELSYVNIITVNGAVDTVDLFERAIKDYKCDHKDRFLPRPKNVNYSQSFSLPSGKDMLNVSIAPVRKKGSNSPALRLNLTVNGPCGAEDTFEDWSQTSHDFLVQAFKDLTTPIMHEQWKFRGMK
jgi:uncharacterized protein (TIGR04255 family)